MFSFGLFVLSTSVAVSVKDRGDGAVLAADHRSAGMREDEERRTVSPTLTAPVEEAMGSLLEFSIDRSGLEQLPNDTLSDTERASVATPWEHVAGELGQDFGNEDHHKWANETILENQNWCRHLADPSHIMDDCVNAASESACNSRFMRLAGAAGNFTQCSYDSGTASCVPGRKYVCTWTFYMKDLVYEQTKNQQNCYGKLLEAKRSLDGLLDSVNVTFRDLMAQNDIIEAMNTTIRGLLEDQQREWSEYIEDQGECVNSRAANATRLADIEDEMTELRTIANPGVRSAVDFNRARGYQDDARGAVTLDQGALGNVNIDAYQEEDRSAFLEEAATMDLSADAAACTRFSSLVQALESRHGIKLVQGPVNCHAEREALQTAFTQAFLSLGDLFNRKNQTIQDQFSDCLNTATYDYKEAVEGPDGIDPKIQTAARQIHAAQSRIALLEPRLHDVEQAVRVMRTHIHHLNSTCTLDENVLGHLHSVQVLIGQMAECPGRNDFYLKIPHWEQTGAPTPAPTPWHSRPNAPTAVPR